MPFCIKKKKKIIEALYISSNKESQDYLFKLLIIVNHYWTAKEDNLDTIFLKKKVLEKVEGSFSWILWIIA